jgi:hypothetical protein
MLGFPRTAPATSAGKLRPPAGHSALDNACSLVGQAFAACDRSRVAVLWAVYDHPHANTDSISGAVREDLDVVVSLQAVCDVLRALTDAGAAPPRRCPERPFGPAFGDQLADRHRRTERRVGGGLSAWYAATPSDRSAGSWRCGQLPGGRF